MSTRFGRFGGGLALSFLALRPASAWWDTQLMYHEPPPTVKTVQAEEATDAPASVVDDSTAWGGKAVRLTLDGPTLSFEHDCKESHYVVYVIARSPRQDFTKPSPPVFIRLRATDLADNTTRQWSQRICFTKKWQPSGHLYCPVYRPGRHRFEVSAGEGTTDVVLVDYLALKDVFGFLPATGEKASQNLHTPEEVARLRRLPSSVETAERLRREQSDAGLADMAPDAAKAWRARVFDAKWADIAPRNLFLNDPRVRAYRNLANLAQQRAEEYLRTGNDLSGWEGVCALLAFCELYPDIDLQSQQYAFDGMQFGVTSEDLGKFEGSHNTNWVRHVAEAYDHLFPLIQDNQELAGLLGAKLPWVRGPKDVVRFLDRNLLQHYRDCVARLIARAPEGESEAALSIMAVVQGPGKAGDWMWDLIFTRNYWRMQHSGGLHDHLHSTLSQDGVNCDVGSAEYTKASAGSVAILYHMAKRYKELGGRLPFDITDLDAYPKMRQTAYYPLFRKAAGVWTPRIGDWGTATDPPQLDERAFFSYARITYLFGHRVTGDPRFAWLVRELGREAESDEEWAAIEAAAERQGRDPFLASRTRNLPGFGMTLLEANPDETDYRRKTAAVLRTGVGMNHGHCDALNLIYYGEGCRLLPDMGRRYRAPAWNDGIHAGETGGVVDTSWWDTTPGGRTSRVHNLVEVDEKDFLNVCYNRTGIGWTEAVQEMLGVSYARGSAWAESHPYLKTFTRDVALVAAGEGKAYAFDVFRVAGGRVHTMCHGGPVNSTPELVRFNTPMSAEKTPLLERYPGPGFGDLIQGASPEVLQITWQVDPAAVRRSLGAMPEYPEVFTRVWRVGIAGLPVIRGWTRVRDWTGAGSAHNFVYVRREGADGLEGAYAAVTEGYTGTNPVVRSVRLLATGAAETALAPRAVEVALENGRTDILYADGDGLARTALPGGIEVQGQFARVGRAADGQVDSLALLGGALLRVGDIRLAPEAPRFTATVQSVDLRANTVRLDRPLPPGILRGTTFHIRRPAVHDAAHLLDRAEGDVLRWRGSMIVYRSAVVAYDAATGGVKGELTPPLLVASPTYYDGLVVANEAGELLGRAKIEFSDRWMYLGFPEHLRWQQRIGMDEIVDADGDGRRTLRLIALHTMKKWLGDGRIERVPEGEKMCDLEVTRVRDDGLMIWFKDPPEQYCYTYDIPHKSWFYQGMRMETEDGRRVLTANYPGTEYAITVPGRRLTAEDFPDADADGRRCLVIADIGPGDVVDAPSAVSLQRVAEGWRIQANSGMALALGAAEHQVLPADLEAGRIVEAQ